MEDPIKKKYIYDEKNQKVAVQLDIDTFEKIEAILEDYAMAQLINKNSSEEYLDLVDAETFYHTLEKAQ